MSNLLTTQDGRMMEVNFQASLPFLGIGAVTLVVSLCFCCYLRRLRQQSHQSAGYSIVRFRRNNTFTDESCAVCLDDFTWGQNVARCPCQHVFHTKCLQQWLVANNSCPLCKKEVLADPEPGESTNLMAGRV